MSDEQTTSELASYVRDAADWAIGEGAHETGHYAKRAADRLEALQARVDALEAEIRQTTSNLSVRTKYLTETAKILSKRNNHTGQWYSRKETP